MRRGAIVLALALVASMASAQELTPEKAKEAQRLYKVGLQQMQDEAYDAAVEQFRKALEIDPLMALAHYNIGQCRMAQRRYQEAAIAYKSCQEAYQQQGTLSQKDRETRDRARRDEINELRDSLARLSQLKGVSDQEAMRIEERLRTLESMQGRDLTENPVPGEVFLALGSAYFRQQKLEDAEREYTQAVKINRRLGAAHNNLAVIFLMTGRPAEAEASLKQAEKNGFKVNAKLKDDIKAAQKKP